MHSGDPSVFMIVLSQRQYNVKASPMLEIIRFLSLYPSKRIDMITELSQIKSSSNYNRFIIYFFIKVLKSLTSVSDEKHTANLDELQRSFLVHNHMYWKSREKKKYFSSFKEACATSYYFIETKLELMGLIERFPFDSYLYTRYADFALIGCGDFEQYQKSMTISADLEKDRNLITDPILHRTIKNNVRVLQFCNTEETIGSLPVHNSHSSNENDVPIASYVKKSRRMIPFLPFVHIFFSIILLLVFFILSTSFESNIQDRFKNLNSISSSLEFLYQKAAFSIMFQYSNSASIEDPSICQESINEMFSSLSSFFVNLPQIQFLYNYSIIFFNDYFLENMKSEKTICQCLNNLSYASYCLSRLYLNELNDQFNLITQQMNDINKRINDKKHDFLHEIIIIAVFVFIIIIYIIVLFVQVNWIFRKKANVIKFLASKKRITSLLLEQCLESWENLYNYIQSRQLYLLHLHSKDPKNSKIPDLPVFNSSSSMISNSDYSSYYESASYSISSTDVSESTMINEEESHDYSNSSDSKNGRSNKKMMNSAVESNDSNINENINKNIEQSFAENNEIEEDPIELAIEATKKQNSFAWLIVPFCILIPNIISILVLLFLIVPAKFRVKLEEEMIDDYIDSCFQINATFNLIKNTYFLLNGNVDYSSSFYENVRNSIIQKKTNITDIFTKNQCLQLQEIVCTTFDSLVDEIGSSPPSHNDLLYLYLPAFIDFGINAISATFSNAINPYSQILTTSIISFFVDFGFVCIYSIYISFLYGFYLLSSFNSLYHFPETLIKKKKGKKRSHNNNEIINSENINRTNINTNYDIKDNDVSIPTLPSTVLKVVSVIVFDEIYSISENAGFILNRPVPSFIGEKFSEVFVPIQYNDPLNDQTNNNNILESTDKNSIISYSNNQIAVKLREHIMPDHVKKKTFRSSSQIRGEFLITLLIEDEIQSIVKSAYKKESISERLMNYVPAYFAKVFTDSNINEVTIDYPLLIFLRYDISKPQTDLDRFFSTINTSIMNYTAFKIIKADGGIFVFCSIKKINQFISYLFIRDIISESANFSKVQPTRAPLTVYVESFDSLNVSLNTDLEPCLEIGIDNINDYEALLYNIGEYQVAFKENFSHPTDTIDEVSQREQISLEGMPRSIKKLSFDKYMELFKKYL